MNVRMRALLIIACCALSFPARGQPDDELVAANPLPCVEAATVDNAHSALDVAAGARECVAAQRFDAAAELMVISMAYTFFDTRRVRDASAHAAIKAMMAEATKHLAPVTADSLMSAMDVLNADVGRKQRVCDQLAHLGPPAYAPAYMVERGQEKSVAPGGAALAEGFDPDTAWAQALAFVKCSA